MIYTVKINDKEYEVEVERGKANILTVSDVKAAPVLQQPVQQQPVKAAPVVSAGDGELLTAPIAGVVLNIKATAGQSFKKGDILLTIEAMKMENEILAPHDGVVEQVLVNKGASVNTGDTLLLMK